MHKVVQISFTAIVLIFALWLALWQADATVKIHQQQMIDTAVRAQKVAAFREKMDSIVRGQNRIEVKLDSLLQR